jgi:acetyl esterase/lipase
MDTATFLGEEEKRHLAVFASWTKRYWVSVSALRAATFSAPRSVRNNIKLLRVITDQAIPKVLLPEGIVIRNLVIHCEDHSILRCEEYLVSQERESNAEAAEDSKDVPCFDNSETTGQDKDSSATRTILYLHGGAYCLCSSSTHRKLLSEIAIRTRARIVALDYSRPPEHPYPAAVHDTLHMYRYLLGSVRGSTEVTATEVSGTYHGHGDVATNVHHNKIVLAGDSAGGGLVVSAMVAIREAGLALPSCAVLLSPWVQLDDVSSPSWQLNR